MSTYKQMPSKKKNVYPKRVRILVYKKFGLLIEFNICNIKLYMLYPYFIF